MEIVIHPARVQPLKTVAVLAFVALASWVLAGLASFGWPVACVLFAVFLFSLRGWLLPTRYVLDDEGLAIGRKRLPWTRFRGWRKERGGYYLSPFSDLTRFDHFRGVYLHLEGVVVRSSVEDVDGALREMLANKVGDGV